MKLRLVLAGIILTAVIIALVIHFRNSFEQNELVLSGNVEVTEVNIGFKIAGRVQSLFTDEGRQIKEGEKIAALDNAEVESLVSQNRASVENAEVQFEKANKDFERYSKLFQDSVISPQQMDSAKTSADAAGSQLRMFRAILRTAEVHLKDSVIHAPLSGVVLRKNVEEGETVNAGTPIVTIGDLENPWIKVYVKEDKLGLVKLGQNAEITVDSFPRKKYKGRVTTIASEAEFTPKSVQTREERVKLVYGVKVSVKNQDNELKPGMPADVKIFIK